MIFAYLLFQRRIVRCESITLVLFYLPTIWVSKCSHYTPVVHLRRFNIIAWLKIPIVTGSSPAICICLFIRFIIKERRSPNIGTRLISKPCEVAYLCVILSQLYFPVIRIIIPNLNYKCILKIFVTFNLTFVCQRKCRGCILVELVAFRSCKHFIAIKHSHLVASRSTCSFGSPIHNGISFNGVD